jgi:hypothetical protein
MQLLSPQFLKDRDPLPWENQGLRKGCCFAGQIALFRKMAAVPEGLPCRRLQQPDRFGESSTAVQKHQPEYNRRMITGS